MLTSLLKKTILQEKFEIDGSAYYEDSLVGEGAYAYVYRVKDSNGSFYALKKIICQTETQIKETEKEIKLLSLIKHTNVLPLLASSYHKNSKKQTEAFLLLPLYGKSTQDIIDQGPGYPKCAFKEKTHVLKILIQCIEAMSAIHSYGYTHCDFKPANVLLDDDMNAVVTDFGSASPLSTRISSRSQALAMQDHASVNTTASFRAPELFDTPRDCVIDGKIDVWGIGCTIFAFMFSRTPFENPVEGLSVLSVLSGSFTIPPSSTWPEEYHTMIKATLRVDFNSRLSLDELRILASMLPAPDIGTTSTGTYGSPTFEATPGIKVDISSTSEDFFAKSSSVCGSDGNFAHFEDFDVKPNATIFRTTLTSDNSSSRTQAERNDGDDSKNKQNDDDDDDDDFEFGDFVQANVEAVSDNCEKSRNVSLSGDAYIMRSRPGPFRKKNEIKKKVGLYHFSCIII